MRDYDPERTLRFAVYGMAIGPIIGQSYINPCSYTRKLNGA